MKTDELKELAQVLLGVAEGKEWEWRLDRFSDWQEPMDGDCAITALAFQRQIRIKLWQLPPPPEGMEWHRDDWTEEMLPEGWRPLLSDEYAEVGDEWRHESCNEWDNQRNESTRPASGWRSIFHRTKRPIPQPQQPDPYAELKAAHSAGKVIQWNIAGGWKDCTPSWMWPEERYRVKPEQQKVPLGPDDVPPGTAIRRTSNPNAAWNMIAAISIDGVKTDRSSFADWESLVDSWEIKRPTDTSWQPCHKLIDTP